MAARTKPKPPKPGSRVKARFSSLEVDGIMIRETITGFYEVLLELEDVDPPVTWQFSPDDVWLADGEPSAAR